jgi:hypothetical protein
MAEQAKLTGPDLGAGVDASTVRDGEPLLGHANGEAVLLVRRRTSQRAYRSRKAVGFRKCRVSSGRCRFIGFPPVRTARPFVSEAAFAS